MLSHRQMFNRSIPAAVSERLWLTVVLAVILAIAPSLVERPACEAAPENTESQVEFDRDVRPIFKTHCFDCHSAETAKGKLRLDNAVGILKGGGSGEPLFIPGRGDESLLIKRLISTNPKEQMPAESEHLSVGEIDRVRQWIQSGAHLPDQENAMRSIRLTTNHWSLQPVIRPEGQSIDEFVIAKLEKNRLSMSDAADKQTLIRRLYLMMHGMPPTPQEVDEFLKDKQSDAYVRLVDRVLDSPRFGERWARHWMDVVRYADSNGFETNRERKTAYHYRDWIVKAFNEDKPYDQFIKEQLAGDQFGVDAATGFLVAGPHDIVKSPDINLTLMQRQDELADIVNTTGTAFLGITLGCARCHNHKFDPVLQKDYYSMQAVFEGVRHGERPLRESMNSDYQKEIAAARSDEQKLTTKLEEFRTLAMDMGRNRGKSWRPPVQPKLNVEEFESVEAVAVRFTVLATSSSSEPCMDELEIYNEFDENVALSGKSSASDTLPGYAIHKLEHINDGKVGNDHSWISNSPGKGWVQIDLRKKTRISRLVWGRDRTGGFNDRLPTKYICEVMTETGKWLIVASSQDRISFQDGSNDDSFIEKLDAKDAEAARQVRSELTTVQARIARLTTSSLAWAGTFSQPETTYRLYRGDPLQKREPVAPDVLSVLGTLGLDLDSPENLRRKKFAEWVADPHNPLTARVIVNRLWQFTFGSGIVDTPSDFGANGAVPTHPELLDWLADEFVNRGWSIKKLQRLMLLSKAFQQSSAPRSDAASIDAAGRLLWRYTPRRLEAEAIRDSMLAVSGALDLRMGGPGFYLMDVVEENVMHYFPKEQFTPTEFRRMVYQFRIRQTTDSVFSSFDCPDGGSVMPKRSRSNTPLQALNLFNSSFVIQQSEILGKRLDDESGGPIERQVEIAFRLFYSRSPDAKELNLSSSFIREYGIESFARAMFNTSEFLFVF